MRDLDPDLAELADVMEAQRDSDFSRRRAEQRHRTADFSAGFASAANEYASKHHVPRYGHETADWIAGHAAGRTAIRVAQRLYQSPLVRWAIARWRSL